MKLVYGGAAGAKPQVERRLKSLGVRGAAVREAAGKLEVFLPGGRGVEGVRRAIATRGLLEFSFVREGQVKVGDTGLPAEVTLGRERGGRGTDSSFLLGPTRAAVEAAAQAVTFPEGRLVVSRDGTGFRTWVVDPKPSLTGDAVASAEGAVDPNVGGPVVRLTFDAAGKTTFSAATMIGTDRRLGILLDGEVMSAPLVMEQIPGGKAVITLGRGATADEAANLAAAIAGHALPEGVVLESESQYAASEAPR